MQCNRCGGFAAEVMEHNAARLKVIRCFACGHRVYPPQHVPADDDFDGICALIEELGGIEHWNWVEKQIADHPGKY